MAFNFPFGRRKQKMNCKIQIASPPISPFFRFCPLPHPVPFMCSYTGYF